MLNDSEIALVRSSFDLVRPIADAAGMLFYERIFTLAPEARSLFGDDIAPQARRTMVAVGTVVDGLDNLDEVAPFLVRLGARHVRYGVLPAHFDVVGAALLWTLEQGLGAEFTPPVQQAWTSAWELIADAMLTGMQVSERRGAVEPVATPV